MHQPHLLPYFIYIYMFQIFHFIFFSYSLEFLYFSFILLPSFFFFVQLILIRCRIFEYNELDLKNLKMKLDIVPFE